MPRNRLINRPGRRKGFRVQRGCRINTCREFDQIMTRRAVTRDVLITRCGKSLAPCALRDGRKCAVKVLEYKNGEFGRKMRRSAPRSFRENSSWRIKRKRLKNPIVTTTETTRRGDWRRFVAHLARRRHRGNVYTVPSLVWSTDLFFGSSINIIWAFVSRICSRHKRHGGFRLHNNPRGIVVPRIMKILSRAGPLFYRVRDTPGGPLINIRSIYTGH